MAIGINSNSGNSGLSLLENISNQRQESMQRLTSGKRINGAKDDAAGLSISVNMASQMLDESRGLQNISDGISLAQTADGALSSVNDALQRMSELALQASNGTLNESNRSQLQGEFSQLQDQIRSVAENTQFNGIDLLNSDAEINIQAGSGEADQVGISTRDLQASSPFSDLLSASIGSLEDATSAISSVATASDSVNELRGEFGATINRFEQIYQGGQAELQQQAESRSRIEDADIAAEVSRNTQADILSQVNIALRGQANADRSNVLQLLQL